MRRPSGGRWFWSGQHSQTSWYSACLNLRRTGRSTVRSCAPMANCPTPQHSTESEDLMTTNPAGPAISAHAVRKSFGDHVVLDGVDLTVPEGTIFALLGPNGAGKTTMVRILSTLIPADDGEAQVGGHDVAANANAVRAQIGVTGQFSAVDNYLTGEENLRLMADLRHLGKAAGRRRIAELLERFDL